MMTQTHQLNLQMKIRLTSCEFLVPSMSYGRHNAYATDDDECMATTPTIECRKEGNLLITIDEITLSTSFWEMCSSLGIHPSEIPVPPEVPHTSDNHTYRLKSQPGSSCKRVYLNLYQQKMHQNP